MSPVELHSGPTTWDQVPHEVRVDRLHLLAEDEFRRGSGNPARVWRLGQQMLLGEDAISKVISTVTRRLLA